MNKDLKSIEWKPLIIAIAIPLAVGGAAAIITHGGFDDYGALHRPPLSPPAWLFPVVWTLLYLLSRLRLGQISLPRRARAHGLRRAACDELLLDAAFL